jgi:O-antigen/teichoic acid export membrane protein
MSRSWFLLTTLAQLSSRGVMLGAGFAQFLYLTRSLGPAGYGLYSVAFSINQFIVLLLEPVVNSGLVPMLAGESFGREFARTCLRISLGTGLLLTLLWWIGAPTIAGLLQTPELVGPLRCLAPAVLLQLLALHSTHCLMGEGHFYAPASSFSLMWLTRLVAGWALVEHGWGAVGAAAAIPLSFGVQFVANQLCGASWVWHSGTLPLRDWWSKSRHLTAGNLLHNAMFNLELPMLKRFVSAPEAGQYAVAQNLGLPVQTTCMTLLPLVQQRLSQTWRDGDRERFLTISGAVLRVGLCLGVGVGTLGLLASDLGRLLFGERYAESGRIGQILLADLGFRCLLWSCLIILTGQRERERISKMYLRATGPLLLMYVVVLAMGSRWVFHERQGDLLLLCAGVSVVRSLVLAWLSWGQVRQAMTVRFPWLTLGRALLAGGVAGPLATRLPGEGWGVLGQVVVQLATYVGLLWVLGESVDGHTPLGRWWRWPGRKSDFATGEPQLP